MNRPVGYQLKRKLLLYVRSTMASFVAFVCRCELVNRLLGVACPESNGLRSFGVFDLSDNNRTRSVKCRALAIVEYEVCNLDGCGYRAFLLQVRVLRSPFLQIHPWA